MKSAADPSERCATSLPVDDQPPTYTVSWRDVVSAGAVIWKPLPMPGTYEPVVARAWKGLVGHIYADGRLGSIQKIGAAPGDVSPGGSYVYGVGAFLLAGEQVEKLSKL